MGQIMFVMWRETVEAMLVVGVLHAWLARQPDARTAQRYLWLGVAAGVVAAVVLGCGIEALDQSLDGEGRDYFQAVLMLLAAALIVQMVFWMRRHGRGMRQQLEGELAQRVAQSQHWGVATLAGIAVAREGSETVVFLGGLLRGGAGFASAEFWLALILGFALAALSFGLLQWGGKRVGWRLFFRVSETLLLLLGCALLVGSVEQLIGLDVVPTGIARVWDSRWLVDDGRTFGSLLAAFTGYRAQPSLTVLVVVAVYWLGVVWRARTFR